MINIMDKPIQKKECGRASNYIQVNHKKDNINSKIWQHGMLRPTAKVLQNIIAALEQSQVSDCRAKSKNVHLLVFWWNRDFLKIPIFTESLGELA